MNFLRKSVLSTKSFVSKMRLAPIGPLELLILQPTPFCNLACDYCYLSDKSSSQRMSMETLRKTFERVFESSLLEDKFTVVWHAGEPLVVGIDYYKQALQIIEQLRPKNIRVSHTFQTNGTLLNKEWALFLKENDFHIGVSIDGPQDLHDQHRKTKSGKGTHHLVTRGIAALKELDVPFYTISVLTAEALHRPDDLFEYFYSLGSECTCFNIEEQEGVHQSSEIMNQNIRPRVQSFFERIFELNQKQDRPMRIREIDGAKGAVLGWKPEWAKMVTIEGTQETTPFKILTVDYSGNFSTFSPEIVSMDIKPYGSFSFGNVHTHRFEDVYTNPKFRQVLKDVRQGLKMCADSCDYYSICGGGSPSNKYFENGTFASSETSCCLLHKKTVVDAVLNQMEHTIQQKSIMKDVTAR